MHPETLIHPTSLLARLCQQEPLVTASGQELPRQLPLRVSQEPSGKTTRTMATLVALDHGNDALKGAMLHASRPALVSRRILTAYAPASILRAGEGVTTWQVQDGEPFWMGQDALLTGKAESLPIGTTQERIPDPRSRAVLFASLVDLLCEAGYEQPARTWQGEHALYVSFGVPNEEVTRSGVTDAVRSALHAIFNVPHLVRRTDELGHTTSWHVRLVELSPYPQTFGSFVTWYYTLEGAAIDTDIVKHVTLDIGGGQMHTCTVTIEPQATGKPRLRMEAALLDEGTIALARALREQVRVQHPGLRLSDAEAQQALVTRTITLGGRRTRIDELVADIVQSRSQRVLTHLRHLLQEEHTFLMFTGGGSILLEESLRTLVSARRSRQSFLFVPKELASGLNAMGGYLLAQATAQKRLHAAQASAEGQR